KYNTTKKAYSTLHAATLKALLNYAKLITASSNGDSLDGLGAVGTQKPAMDIIEYPSTDGSTHVVVYNRMKGKFIASKIDNPISLNMSPYEFKDGYSSGSALVFSLIPKSMENTEFSETFAEFLKEYNDKFPDLEKSCETAALLCDNIYRRVSSASTLGDEGLPASIPSTNNITPITSMVLTQGTYSPAYVTVGDFTIMKPGILKSKKKNTISAGDFVGQYTLSERTFSSKEKELIPSIPSWYVIPAEVETICKHIKATTSSEQPMRNFLLRGPSGTGKTEGAKAIAAGLSLPYMYVTCSANTEIFDLVGQILPDMAEKVSDDISLPSFDDIRMDPSSAYERLTGEYDEEIDENDVYQKLIEVIQSNAGENSNTEKKQGFKYVETDFVKALKLGCVIEIQEPTVIANPGVLVGLNSLLDRCNGITLPTGERIERHPETVVVVTTNVSYEGCKNLNQSIISRMNLVIDVDEPDTDTLVKRVTNITGCKEKPMVKKMASAVNEIVQKCKETMITDGNCGVRELISWVQSYMILGDAIESAKHTVLSSVSSDPENRDEIFSTCIEPIF
ncbi:MAG: AAA family ATPase, partial [Clostridia bacterium]